MELELFVITLIKKISEYWFNWSVACDLKTLLLSKCIFNKVGYVSNILDSVFWYTFYILNSFNTTSMLLNNI